MWAPADLFGPTVNAVALAIKRAATFVANHLVLLCIAAAVLVAFLVVVAQVRSRTRR